MRLVKIERGQGIINKSNRIWTSYVTGTSNKPRPICIQILTDKDGDTTFAIGTDTPEFVIDVQDVIELIEVWKKEK